MRKQSSVIKIGGASGYWGDASMSTPQLIATGDLDYLVYDYLAEITMSILARARLKDERAGFAGDFVSDVLKNNLREIAVRKIKVISNAGGVNVQACGEAVRTLVAALGLDLKVAVVSGDDLLHRRDDMTGYAEMFSGAPFPPGERVLSINAYLGAFPIARALDDGADIVVTGRCVDSAVTLGACIHAFGWASHEHDKLAAGSLAGHIIECGAQASGGNFTDWELVADTMDTIGYPIVEISPDGSFVCTKPPSTGGLVSVGTVAEQMVYEIGDPQAYFLPDVVCDFADVQITQSGTDRVTVRGARGYPAPDTYKVSVTYEDGFRGGRLTTFYGRDSDRKAEKFSAALFRRARAALRQRNLADFLETSVEVLGAESQYGASRTLASSREVVVKTAVRHGDKAGVEVFLRELNGLGLAAPPGISGFQGGRASASPVVRMFSFLLPKAQVKVTVDLGAGATDFTEAPGQTFDPARVRRADVPDTGAPGEVDDVVTPLWALAFGRSGDKGDKANIGLIARDPEFYPYIRRAIDVDVVAARFGHFVRGAVERFDLPGVCGVNFLLHEALSGGGIASLRSDAQAKGYAQLLLDHLVAVPRALAARKNLPVSPR